MDSERAGFAHVSSEVDFVVLQDTRPQFAVECKLGEKSASPYLKYFKERTEIPVFYQVHTGSKDYEVSTGIRVLPLLALVRERELP